MKNSRIAGLIRVSLIFAFMAIVALPWRASPAQDLPRYGSPAATPVSNPFVFPGMPGDLPPCPHVCLLVQDGESAEEAVARFERQNHCRVTADGADGGDTTDDREMQFSVQGRDLLKAIETLRLKPYDDQTGKEITSWVAGATIGYGHLISRQDWPLYKDGITEDQANQLFEDDISPFVSMVNKAITVRVSQQQFDALVLLAYNIGPNFSSSSVVKLVNDPNAVTPYASLEDAWKAWNKSQGKVNNGLNNRRNAEWKIYSEGIYERW